ncbi:MAG: manganese-dependent inorganic pyrophosphatase [Patescibacteria group bacterium]|nr:manganese-dependent inorganic pyrophosphatase [Patescibacteria group bacterium]
MLQKIYIIGHKSPDLDSVAAAISYAGFKNKQENTDIYMPAITEDINQITKFVLDKFNLETPKILNDANGKKVILVDHNEASQSLEGINAAEIVEILDHHKLNFQYDRPIAANIKPWGATCSILAQMYLDNNINIDKNLAGLMLSAILDDTLITKSPTCTDKDKELIEKLTGLAGISDWKAYGLEMFKVKSSVKDFTDLEIIKNDFKDFEFKAGKFGIGQVETVDLSEFDARAEALLATMKKMREKENYHSVILFFTDVIKECSRFLIASDNKKNIVKALGGELKDNKACTPSISGIMSRKKQVVPLISKVFDK